MQKFLIILSLLIEVTHGQEAELPDIARSFKNAKLISTTEIDPFNKVLSFGSNETYETLKAQLLATLGAGWRESKEKEATRPKPQIAGLKNPSPDQGDFRRQHRSHQRGLPGHQSQTHGIQGFNF